MKTKIEQVNTMNRRNFLQTMGVVSAAGMLPGVALAADESELIYLSPLKSNGNLSRCQAEVWFVQDAADQYVVTSKDAWRAVAINKGLTKTQVWVGDVGQWRSSSGRYKGLPSHMADASSVTDAIEHVRLLTKFGTKYPKEWGTWGPRFRKGLADGSRVMLRYRPIS